MTQTNIKLQKWGNSQGIRLSKDILEELGIFDLKNIEFSVEISENKILLEAKTELSPYEQLFKDYDFKDYDKRIKFEWEDEKPVGREFW